MADPKDVVTGFMMGSLSVMTLGCLCWISFTDLILADFETGDRGLGIGGTLGMPSLCVAGCVGMVGGIGVLSHRAERVSWTAILIAFVYLGLFAFVLFAGWIKPMWRVV